jgi:hypothetical protein
MKINLFFIMVMSLLLYQISFSNILVPLETSFLSEKDKSFIAHPSGEYFCFVPENIRELLVVLHDDNDSLIQSLKSGMHVIPQTLMNEIIHTAFEKLDMQKSSLYHDDYQEAIHLLKAYQYALDSGDASFFPDTRNGCKVFCNLLVRCSLTAGNLVIEKNGSFGGSLNIHEDLNVGGDVTISGNEIVAGNLIVGGIIEDNFIVGCNINILTNPSTALCGNITKGAAQERFIHNFGAGNDTSNFYAGINAGSFTATAVTGRNTGVGSNSLNSLLAGVDNTAFGANALRNNTDGSANTAVGVNALLQNEVGLRNVAVGLSALGTNAAGVNNIAIGASALVNNFSGSSNTAVGDQALAANNSSSANIAIGNNALLIKQAGDQNIALGVSSLSNMSAGTNNIAIGNSSGTAFTGGEVDNIIIGNPGVLGDSGAIRIGTAATHTTCFVQGIAGNGPFAETVSIDPATGQLGVGGGGACICTCNLTLTTNPSTALCGNIIKGTDRFMHNFGAGIDTSNVYAGINAGNFTASAIIGRNSGFGVNALNGLTSGANNTAVGFEALRDTNTGSGNTAVGVLALPSNTTGFFNTAMGLQALFSNTSGARNSAFGIAALLNNDSGVDNTAVGNGALSGNDTGINNVAIGTAAGQVITSGSNNIIIGTGADVTGSATRENGILLQTRTTAVGGTGLTADDQIRIGFGTTASTTCFIDGIAGAGPFANTVTINPATGQLGGLASSKRYKENVKPLQHEQQKLLQLNPVSFTYKSDPGHTQWYGFIAEEVEMVYPEIVVRNSQGEVESINYNCLPALIIKQMQMLQDKVEELQNRIRELEKSN